MLRKSNPFSKNRCIPVGRFSRVFSLKGLLLKRGRGASNTGETYIIMEVYSTDFASDVQNHIIVGAFT